MADDNKVFEDFQRCLTEALRIWLECFLIDNESEPAPVFGRWSYEELPPGVTLPDLFPSLPDILYKYQLSPKAEVIKDIAIHLHKELMEKRQNQKIPDHKRFRDAEAAANIRLLNELEGKGNDTKHDKS